MIRTFLPKEPHRIEFSLTAVLYALSDEVRLGIIRQLADRGPCTCGEFEIDRPKSSLSHHFRVLRESGVVATRREGTTLLNTLRRDDLDAAFPGLLSAVLSSALSHGRRKRARGKLRSHRHSAMKRKLTVVCAMAEFAKQKALHPHLSPADG